MAKSQYFDIPCICQIIGNVFNKPDLFADERYSFNKEDFFDSFHQLIFSTIYNVYQLNKGEVNLPTIDDYLSRRPRLLAEYNSNKGADYILKCAEIADKDSFNYYYSKLKKFTLLRQYEKLGMDLSWFLDMNNVFDTKKKKDQEDRFDSMEVEDIANLISDKIELIRLEYTHSIDSASAKLGDGVLELLDDLKKTPSLGYPFYTDYMNTVTRGARNGKFYLRSAPTGTGKAIPNETMIPTPTGWRRVGDIKVGDYLFGQDGKKTKVLAIHPQKTEKEIWEVEFSDGRIAKCCSEHLWEYQYESHRTKEYRVESLGELYNRTLTLKNGLKTSDNKGYRFHIKLNEAIEYEEKEYSVHPYVIGAFLGDGSFRYDNTNKALTFSSKDDKIPSKIARLLGNCIYKKNSKFNYSYTFKHLDNLEHNLWVEEILKDYPSLWQAKSENKFIPEDYLKGSISQRYELLRGLLDTDGSINKKGSVQFTTTSEYLKDNIIELVRSLGMIANYSVDKREEKYTTGKCYSIIIQSKKEDKPNMFSLDYKVQIATDYANSSKRNEYKDHLAIIDIRPTKMSTKMTCFTVANKDHLFLMNDFIVTHNTRLMVADACFIGCSKMWDTHEQEWISIGAAQPTLYIATEQDLEEVTTMALAFIAGIDEDHILKNDYKEGEWERAKEASTILKNGKVFFECIPDFGLEDIENLIKKHIRKNEIQYCFFDYIHSSAKVLVEVGGKSGVKNLREDNVLFLMASKLKDICVQYNIFILSSTQLNASYVDNDTPDQNCLRGSKAVADRIDVGMIMLDVTESDKERLEKICDKTGMTIPNVKISVYKNRQNRYRGIYLWCYADKSTCRFQGAFLTDWSYNIITAENLKIKVEEESLF